MQISAGHLRIQEEEEHYIYVWRNPCHAPIAHLFQPIVRLSDQVLLRSCNIPIKCSFYISYKQVSVGHKQFAFVQE